ncbi:MAG: hypothetical protein ACK55Z_27480, partial [bacterium]
NYTVGSYSLVSPSPKHISFYMLSFIFSKISPNISAFLGDFTYNYFNSLITEGTPFSIKGFKY